MAEDCWLWFRELSISIDNDLFVFLESPRSIAADLLGSALDVTIARWRYVIREQNKNQLQFLNICTGVGEMHPTTRVFVKTVRI